MTYADFAGREGDRFDVTGDDGKVVPMELLEATEGTEPGGHGPEGQERLQFSVVFGGPSDPVLPQRTRALSHPELGELELFLVPIGPGTDGMRYEAAFA